MGHFSAEEGSCHVTAAEVCIIISVATEVWGGTMLSLCTHTGGCRISNFPQRGQRVLCGAQGGMGWSAFPVNCCKLQLQHVY